MNKAPSAAAVRSCAVCLFTVPFSPNNSDVRFANELFFWIGSFEWFGRIDSLHRSNALSD